LNVSSAGLDWPIVTDFDFERNVDEELEIGLYQKLGKDKNYVGVLKSYSSESIIIVDKKGKEIEIPRNLIPKATKYIKF
ncbi:MAG: ribosome maturation factor RimP, partial [Clostridia bacterium]|nr:ribosome maturation factor RimP [Clostridia bacterium]